MTDNEIIQALRGCEKWLGHDDACENCKVGEIQKRREYIEFAAANAIERLSAMPEQLQKEIEWKDMVIDLAQRKQAKAEAERDALREKVPQWISVEDRLPEIWKNEDGVFVNYMIYSPYFGVDIGNYHKKAGTWLCMALPCTVTHWMPLPGAPEEGDKRE